MRAFQVFPDTALSFSDGCRLIRLGKLWRLGGLGVILFGLALQRASLRTAVDHSWDRVDARSDLRYLRYDVVEMHPEVTGPRFTSIEQSETISHRTRCKH